MAKRCIGLVVQALNVDGGVPAVARFIRDTALRTQCYDVRVVSLATSANDQESLLERRSPRIVLVYQGPEQY